MTTNELELQDLLSEGESVVVVAEGLVRESGVIFDRCRIVLTADRLIVLKQGWPWGFKVDRSIPRQECSLKNHKVRFDGSQLLVVGHSAGDLCVYLGGGQTDEATMLLDEIPASA